MYVVATETGDSATIHDALHEVVALHSVFVRSAIREVVEVSRAQSALFQSPVIFEPFPHLVANRPVVVFPLKRNCDRASLRMALDASVAGFHIVGVRRIENVGPCWVLDVFAAGPVASFAADIPFCDPLGVDVITYGMAAVAGRAGRSLHVVRREKRHPPVRTWADEILAPFVIFYLPLRRQREIVVSNFRKIPLLPKAAVNKGHLIQIEFRYAVASKVGNKSFGMFSRIAYHVRHRSLLPALINIGVALLARS